MGKGKETHRAYGTIFLAAALWGIIGLWNRGLMAQGLSPVDIVAVRNSGGMIILALFFALRDRSVFHIKKEHLKYFFGTGIISVVFFTLCYFSCQKICSLSVASVLLYTAPSFVVILSAILWQERITKQKILALVLTLIGCAMVCGLFSGEAEMTTLGILLGLGAGFFYALYSIFGRYALAHYSPMTVTVWTFLFAGTASLFLIRPLHMATLFSIETLFLSLALAIISTVAPYLLYTSGLSKVEAGRASIIASLEPVVASLTGVLVFHESINFSIILGILCVLAGVYILR